MDPASAQKVEALIDVVRVVSTTGGAISNNSPPGSIAQVETAMQELQADGDGADKLLKVIDTERGFVELREAGTISHADLSCLMELLEKVIPAPPVTTDNIEKVDAIQCKIVDMLQYIITPRGPDMFKEAGHLKIIAFLNKAILAPESLAGMNNHGGKVYRLEGVAHIRWWSTYSVTLAIGNLMDKVMPRDLYARAHGYLGLDKI